MSDDIKKKRKKRKKKKKDPNDIIEYYRKYRNSPSGKASILRYKSRNKWNVIHSRCIKRHRNKLKLGIYTEEMDFDANYLKNLFYSQKERCYWLGLCISVDNPENHPLKPSIDRLDNNKGYMKDNIVITSLLANRARNTTTVEEWKVICDQIKTPKGLVNILDED